MFNFLTIGWSVVKAIRLRQKKVSVSDYPPSLEENDSIVELSK